MSHYLVSPLKACHMILSEKRTYIVIFNVVYKVCCTKIFFYLMVELTFLLALKLRMNVALIQ